MATINDEASLYLRVNGEDAKKEFARVKETVEDLKKKLVEAGKAGDFRQVEELRKQLRPAVKQMDSMLLNIGRIDAAMKNLSLQTPKELRRTIQLINAEMNSGAVEMGSKEWKEHEANRHRSNRLFLELRAFKGIAKKVLSEELYDHIEFKARQEAEERMKNGKIDFS